MIINTNTEPARGHCTRAEKEKRKMNEKRTAATKLIRMKRVEGDATVTLAEQGGRTVVVLSDRSLTSAVLDVPDGQTAESVYEAM